jgi:hypothetical protein
MARTLLLSVFNFAIIVVIVFWAVRKFVPGMLRGRSASIQQALQEARAASQDANRRLADIENRLRQLDVEIGQMQAARKRKAQPRKSASRKPPKTTFAKWCWLPNRKSRRRQTSPPRTEQPHRRPGHCTGSPTDSRRFQYRPGSGPHFASGLARKSFRA